MSGQFEVVRDPILGEEVWLATTTAGLRIRVLPREHIREAAAAIAFNYGSVDLEFEDGGQAVQTPAGTAHYLEHKLFEDEELAVFQRFAQRGARVNAQTGFSRTTYYFLATSAIRENLQDLLRLVSKPHITQENVDKERGIIWEESIILLPHKVWFVFLSATIPNARELMTGGGGDGGGGDCNSGCAGAGRRDACVG